MRTRLLDYIRGLNLKSFRLSDELPFSQNGAVLYLKNPKRVYVDNPQKTVDDFVLRLDGNHIEAESTVIRVYFASDSKQQPEEYADAVNLIRNFRNESDLRVYFQRDAQVITEYEQDLTVTSIEFTFRKLI